MLRCPILAPAGFKAANPATGGVEVEVAGADAEGIDDLHNHTFAPAGAGGPGDVEALATVGCLPVSGKDVAEGRVDHLGLVRGARVGDARTPKTRVGGGASNLGVEDCVILVACCRDTADGDQKDLSACWKKVEA